MEEQKAFRAGIEEEKAAALTEARKQAQTESSALWPMPAPGRTVLCRRLSATPQSRKEEILRQAQGEITEIIVAATAKVAGVSVGGDSDLYDEFLKKAGEEHE